MLQRKKITLALLIPIVLAATPTQGGVELIPTDPRIKEIKKAIHHLQPSADPQLKIQVANNVHRYSTELGLDWKLFLSILFQESGLKRDPGNCIQKEYNRTHKGYKIPKAHCEDYGIAQINFRTWGEELNLDKKLLLTDIDYSIGTAATILRRYKEQYAAKDSRWYLHYHSGTPEYRLAYHLKLKQHYKTIIASLKLDSRM